MHQAGFNQAVASLGTALTDGQANLIKRYVKDVLVCYDSDGPGTKASLRAIGIFRNAGLRTKVINMEPCKDADEFIKTYGADAFQKRIDDAENSFLYEVRILERNYDLNDPAGKTSFFNEVSVKLASFEEEIERNNYIEAVASKYFISADSLRKLVAKYAAAVAGIKVNEIPKREKREKENGIDKSQRMLLTFIADDTGIYKKIADYISPEDFSEGIYRNVAEIMFENLEEILIKYEDINMELASPDVTSDQRRFRNLMKEQSDLTPLVEAYTAYKKANQDIKDSLEMLEEENDEEMREMLKEELSSAKDKVAELEEKIKILLLPKDPNDDKNVIVEIRAGAGGDEAALFAAELFRMYTHYAEARRWKVEVVNSDETGIGGMKEVEFMVTGQGAYSVLKYESGVHRVQRVPETESGGRIHTLSLIHI